MKEEKKSHEDSDPEAKKEDIDFLIVQPEDVSSVVESVAPPTKKELRFLEKEEKLKKKKKKMTLEEKEKEVKKTE